MSTEDTSLTTTAPAAPVRGFADLMANPDSLGHAWKLAGVLAATQLIPTRFQGKREDCLVALVLAQELRENPLVLMQNMHTVHGQPGFATKYMVGRLNQSGRIVGPVRYREEGNIGRDGYEVTAYAIDKATGEEVAFTVPWSMAVGEGWLKNSKYKTMPQVMMRYRAATFLIRMHYPDVLLGYRTAEEVEDVSVAGSATQTAPQPRPTDPAAEFRAAAGLAEPEVVDVEPEPADDGRVGLFADQPPADPVDDVPAEDADANF